MAKPNASMDANWCANLEATGSSSWASPAQGNGLGGTSYGLPRCAEVTFDARFPFGTVTLRDRKVPLHIAITGWSPFTPGDADSSSLLVAALEYRFVNPTGAPLRLEPGEEKVIRLRLAWHALETDIRVGKDQDVRTTANRARTPPGTPASSPSSV